MIFKNLITKVKKDKTKKDLETQIANDIVNIEAGRLNLRTQFDRGVVTHFEAQETLLDYSLAHLGVNTPGAVQHPVIVSEPPANLNASRAAMSELLFECYRVPSVSYFVDALASLQHNQPDCRDALVVSCGYHATHVLPVLDGRMVAADARRIDVGGFLMCSYLQRLLQLKNPASMASVTLSRAEEILHELTRFALDYRTELCEWADPAYRERHRRLLQLPGSVAAAGRDVPEAVGPEAAGKRKREQQERMWEMHRKKRQSLVDKDVERLCQVRQTPAPDTDRILELEARIEQGRAKLASWAASRGRQATLQLAATPEEVEEQLEALERRRRELLDRRATRRQRRSEMARRRTAASQQRMRIISQLAQRETKEDTFGQRDEDWDLYKTINTEGGSDSEADTEELQDVESRLRQLAPDLPRRQQQAPGGAASYQIPLTTEALQTPEILFQPSMLGLNQAGLAETVQFVLRKFPAAEQQRLADNVFITGGVARLPGLAERLERELRQMRPFQSSFRVSVAGSPSLDAWRGARAAASCSSQQLQLVTRQLYLDCGAEYLAEHALSNSYCATPAVPAKAESAAEEATASTSAVAAV